ncbi:MAG: Appr-1-p processing protein [Chloracidobacterium sp. CP2_5A]|nr:MAG: Appr-1-p processing protein [Chloracidobacterium sp. CP2_5A]
MDAWIILAAIDDDLADAWERRCGDLPGVSIYRGSILDLAVDAVVSPSNSFGFMDGGLDYLYARRFGWETQARLQALIRARHHGELLVGTAEIVETGHPRSPYLIAAPTMRVPMALGDTVNVYLAARAVLLLIKHGVMPAGALAGEPVAAAVQSVAFPGLGTGVGQVSPNACAHQMRAAIEEVALGRGQYPRSCAEARERHQRLCAGPMPDSPMPDSPMPDSQRE